jgi:predicted phosphate transport protein (TIGR00153 family)
MLGFFMPKDDLFFERFNQIALLITEATVRLKTMLDEGGSFEEHAKHIKGLERQSDQHIHEAFKHLHKTFVTPFDRQHIHKLCKRLDDILDLTEAAATRVELYLPKEMKQEGKELSAILVDCAKNVAEMVGLLKDIKKNTERINELSGNVHKLETEADDVRRKALARLFKEEEDTRELIKWRSILEHIERATDRCEGVANVVEAIVLENS